MTKLTQCLVSETTGRSNKIYAGTSISEIEKKFNVKVIAVLGDIWM